MKAGQTQTVSVAERGTLPPQLVARRNARERRRVQAVNTAFARLRRVVPLEHTRGKRVSKVKTLQRAIEYISDLLSLLHQPQSPQQHWVSTWDSPASYRECRLCAPDLLSQTNEYSCPRA